MKNRPEPTCVAVRISPGPYALVVVSGELDLVGVPVLEAAVANLELSSVRAVVLDLRRLAFIDAIGLHAVVDLHSACLKAATGLMIVPGPRNVQRLFELTGADRRLPFAPDHGPAGGATGTASEQMQALLWVSRKANSDPRPE